MCVYSHGYILNQFDTGSDTNISDFLAVQQAFIDSLEGPPPQKMEFSAEEKQHDNNDKDIETIVLPPKKRHSYGKWKSELIGMLETCTASHVAANLAKSLRLYKVLKRVEVLYKKWKCTNPRTKAKRQDVMHWLRKYNLRQQIKDKKQQIGVLKKVAATFSAFQKEEASTTKLTLPVGIMRVRFNMSKEKYYTYILEHGLYQQYKKSLRTSAK